MFGSGDDQHLHWPLGEGRSQIPYPITCLVGYLVRHFRFVVLDFGRDRCHFPILFSRIDSPAAAIALCYHIVPDRIGTEDCVGFRLLPIGHAVRRLFDADILDSVGRAVCADVPVLSGDTRQTGEPCAQRDGQEAAGESFFQSFESDALMVDQCD